MAIIVPNQPQKSNPFLTAIISFLIGMVVTSFGFCIVLFSEDDIKDSEETTISTLLSDHYITDDKVISYDNDDADYENPYHYNYVSKEDMLDYIAEQVNKESSIEALFQRLKVLHREGFITFTNRAIWYNGPDNDGLTDIQIFLKGEDDYTILNLEKYPKTY